MRMSRQADVNLSSKIVHWLGTYRYIAKIAYHFELILKHLRVLIRKHMTTRYTQTKYQHIKNLLKTFTLTQVKIYNGKIRNGKQIV